MDGQASETKCTRPSIQETNTSWTENQLPDHYTTISWPSIQRKKGNLARILLLWSDWMLIHKPQLFTSFISLHLVWPDGKSFWQEWLIAVQATQCKEKEETAAYILSLSLRLQPGRRGQDHIKTELIGTYTWPHMRHRLISKKKEWISGVNSRKVSEAQVLRPRLSLPCG